MNTRTTMLAARAITLPRWALLLGSLALLACGAAGGWRLATLDRGPADRWHTEFSAVVESVQADGLHGCFTPLDPVQLDRLGVVCGRFFRAGPTDVQPSQRVHVEWLDVVMAEEESVDALLVSAARP